MKTLAETINEVIAKTKLVCPKCHGELEVFYQRQQKLFAIMHRHRTDCPIEEFGRSKKGGTRDEAWESAREALNATPQ